MKTNNLAIAIYISNDQANNMSVLFVVDKMKVFKSFLAAGIDVNKCTVSEIYPLIIAVWLRSEDSVKLILKMGGDVNIMDNYYDTPLTTALEFDLGEIVNDLLKAKANVNHKGGEKLVQWIVENEGTIFYN